MKKIYSLLLMVLQIILLSQFVNAQNVLDPNDPIVNYNSGNPPATPPNGTIAKWVITKTVSWNTSSFKAYYYNGMAFRLKYPKTYHAGDTTRYPVLIFLHGLGELGTIYNNDLQLYHCAQDMSNADDNGDFNAFILFPQSTNGWWSSFYFTALNGVINYMDQNKMIDLNRLFVSGLSGGGQGDWEYILEYPKMFAGAEIISAAALDYEQNINSVYKYVPIWLSQGSLDTGPYAATAEQLTSAMEAVGSPITYTEYAGYGHNVWDIHYEEPDAFPYYNRQNKVNPVVFFGKTDFCPEDTANINITLGLTPGFDGYQWRKNGNVISGATSNTLVVHSLGTYDARIKRGDTWSYWSPTPAVIKVKQPTATPNIQVKNLMSSVIPAPDGNSSVKLTLPSGYASYQWKKQGSSTILSTQQTFTTSDTGNYIAQVTETEGCSSNPSAPFYVASSSGTNPPDPISNLSGFATSQTQIQLSWTDKSDPVHNETGFEIYRSTTSGGPYKLIFINHADSLSFTDNNLTAKTKYYYIIRSIDSTSASPLSQEASIVTQVDSQPPTAPNLALLGTSQNSISLSWTASTDNVGISKYYIYVNGSRSYTTTDTSFIIYNLDHGKLYSFYIKAADPTGNLSTPSNQVVASAILKGLNYKYYTYTGSWSSLPDLTTLTPVKTGIVNNVTLDPRTQETNFAFEWDGYINITSTGTYKFFTSSDDGSALYINGTRVVNNDGLHATTEQSGNYTFNQKGAYAIRILFYQEGGGYVMTTSWQKTSSPKFSKSIIPDSAFAESYTMPGNPSTAPSGIKATATSYNTIKLTWNDNSNNETGFEIYRATSLSGPFSIIKTTAANITSYTDTLLTPSTTYYYKVQSINKYGSSGFNAADLGGLSDS